IINTSSIDNDATTGAGIYCFNSEVNLDNVTVTGNTAKFVAGIDCGNSTLNIIDSNISNNLSSEAPGGIALDNSEVYIGQSIVSGNWGNGIFIGGCDPILEDVIISSNTYYRGAGMYCYGSNPVLRNVTIRDNISFYRGGGLYLREDSNPIFDPDSRSNIYMNSALTGRDIYTENPITVIVDTFTVLNPTSLYAFPIQEIIFDILHGYIPQVNADLFVSPDGDDSNSGLSWNEPLRTINCAFSRILADSLDPHTIYLSEGTFSSATNGEVFPIVCVDHVSIEGEGIDETLIDIYDASYSSGLYLDYIQDCTLSSFTIKSNDYTAIRCLNNSCPILADLRICDSYVGISCENNSAPYFSHVLV
ncbi:DUF1565 domain-containing protein, partial [bacterium]|nr:DUF1565 domain-containing protein [bacterium]